MPHQRREKLSVLQVRVAFEPNRFEHSALQSAYERIVPVLRKTMLIKDDNTFPHQGSEPLAFHRKEKKR